jgi:hypothetical protein
MFNGMLYAFTKYYPLGELKTPEPFEAQSSRLKAQSS